MGPLALDLPFSESQNSILCSVSLEHIFFPLNFFLPLVFTWTGWTCHVVSHVYICRRAAQGSSVCIEVTPSLGLGCSPSWDFSSSSCAHSKATLPLLAAVPSPGVRLLVPMAPCLLEEEKETDSGGEWGFLIPPSSLTQPGVFPGLICLFSWNLIILWPRLGLVDLS